MANCRTYYTVFHILIYRNAHTVGAGSEQFVSCSVLFSLVTVV
jgi:hypothetical protein